MKILWTSGTSQAYFQTVFGYNIRSWKYLNGDKVIYTDQPFTISGYRTKESRYWAWTAPEDFNTSEFKFFKKSRSIVSALNDGIKHYDYVIWVDGDVEVLQQPKLDVILPKEDEIVSAVQKPGKNGTGLDTGFVAFNLKHKKINDLLFEYTYYWQTDKINSLSYRFDAPVLEDILKKYKWKNLLIDDERLLGKKNHCGFDNSLLDPYFRHYWGKKQKQQMINNL